MSTRRVTMTGDDLCQLSRGNVPPAQAPNATRRERSVRLLRAALHSIAADRVPRAAGEPPLR